VAADGIGFLGGVKHSSYSGHDLLAKLGIVAARQSESPISTEARQNHD
jgi:hypothetical protein